MKERKIKMIVVSEDLVSFAHSTPASQDEMDKALRALEDLRTPYKKKKKKIFGKRIGMVSFLLK